MFKRSALNPELNNIKKLVDLVIPEMKAMIN